MMDRYGIVGVTWRYADEDQIASFTIPGNARRSRLEEIKQRIGVDELLYLSTCNRAEFVFLGSPRTPIGEYRRRLLEHLVPSNTERSRWQRIFRGWQGEGAVEHLFLLAAGLDSAQPGEREIRGQLRAALEHDTECGSAGEGIGGVVRAAVRCARRVHAETGIGEGRTSLAEIAAHVLLEHHSHRGGRIALVGISPMTESCADRLRQHSVPLLVVNRTVEKAEALAGQLQQLGADAVSQSLDSFRWDPPPVSAVLLCTGSASAVLEQADLGRLIRASKSSSPRAVEASPLIVDMAIPPDVRPEDAEALELQRIGMDQINAQADATRERRQAVLAEARAMVDDALSAFRNDRASRSLAGVITAIGTRYRGTLEQGLEKLFETELKTLDETLDLERWTRSMSHRLSHLPVVGLRALAEEFGPRAVETFLKAASPELLEHYRPDAVDTASEARDASEAHE